MRMQRVRRGRSLHRKRKRWMKMRRKLRRKRTVLNLKRRNR